LVKERRRLCWRSLNRLRIGVGRAKANEKTKTYIDVTWSTQCDCGEEQTAPSLLGCDCWTNRARPKTNLTSPTGQRCAPRNGNLLDDEHDKKKNARFIVTECGCSGNHHTYANLTDTDMAFF